MSSLIDLSHTQRPVIRVNTLIEVGELMSPDKTHRPLDENSEFSIEERVARHSEESPRKDTRSERKSKKSLLNRRTQSQELIDDVSDKPYSITARDKSITTPKSQNKPNINAV